MPAPCSAAISRNVIPSNTFKYTYLALLNRQLTKHLVQHQSLLFARVRRERLEQAPWSARRALSLSEHREALIAERPDGIWRRCRFGIPPDDPGDAVQR